MSPSRAAVALLLATTALAEPLPLSAAETPQDPCRQATFRNVPREKSCDVVSKALSIEEASDCYRRIKQIVAGTQACQSPSVDRMIIELEALDDLISQDESSASLSAILRAFLDAGGRCEDLAAVMDDTNKNQVRTACESASGRTRLKLQLPDAASDARFSVDRGVNWDVAENDLVEGDADAEVWLEVPCFRLATGDAQVRSRLPSAGTTEPGTLDLRSLLEPVLQFEIRGAPDDTVTSLRTGSEPWRDVRLRNGATHVVCYDGVENDAKPGRSVDVYLKGTGSSFPDPGGEIKRTVVIRDRPPAPLVLARGTIPLLVDKQLGSKNLKSIERALMLVWPLEDLPLGDARPFAGDYRLEIGESETFAVRAIQGTGGSTVFRFHLVNYAFREPEPDREDKLNEFSAEGLATSGAFAALKASLSVVVPVFWDWSLPFSVVQLEEVPEPIVYRRDAIAEADVPLGSRVRRFSFEHATENADVTLSTLPQLLRSRPASVAIEVPTPAGQTREDSVRSYSLQERTKCEAVLLGIDSRVQKPASVEGLMLALERVVRDRTAGPCERCSALLNLLALFNPLYDPKAPSTEFRWQSYEKEVCSTPDGPANYRELKARLERVRGLADRR